MNPSTAAHCPRPTKLIVSASRVVGRGKHRRIRTCAATDHKQLVVGPATSKQAFRTRPTLPLIRPAPGRTFYFGFGANLSPEVVARRQLRPRSAAWGTVHGYQLYFQHVGGYATIFKREKADRPDVCGVLYDLSAAEMWALSLTEGGYDVETVVVETEDGRRYEAQAFVTNWLLRLFDEAPPSKRYLRIIREGARHHQLPVAYQEWLATVEQMFAANKEPRYFNSPSSYIATAVASAMFAGVTALVARPRR